jgi:hypothetical protein
VKAPSPFFRKKLPCHARHRRGVETAAQLRAHRKSAPQAASHRLGEYLVEGIGVLLVRREPQFPRRVESPVAIDRGLVWRLSSSSVQNHQRGEPFEFVPTYQDLAPTFYPSVGLEVSVLSFDGADMNKSRTTPTQEQDLRGQGLRKAGASLGHEAAGRLHGPDDFLGGTPLRFSKAKRQPCEPVQQTS